MILKIRGQNIIRFSFKTNATRIKSLLNATCRVTVTKREMVTLIVATTSDPASINPAAALLAMPGWTAGPILPPDMKSFVNKQTRVIQHDGSIVKEDDLDSRWEEAAGEAVDEVIFLSRHTAVSNRPALTVHPIGVLHLKEGESPPQGGKPGWAALTSPRIGPWLRLLKKMAEAHSLVPEFEITLEGTHHGPITSKPTMFLEIGSTEEYWKRQDAAQVMALLMWEGLGLGGGEAVGDWNSETGKRKVLLGIGGGHYAPVNRGKPGWAALTSPRIGPWLRLLKKMAEAYSLVPEFEITLEGTHHGPITSKPTMFLEIGSTEEYWKRQDAAQVMALLMWEGLGLGGGEAVGDWNSETGKRKVLLGIGGGHYAPRHMDVVLKDDVWVGHLLSGYSLPMEEPKPGEKHIGGTWRQSIQAAFEATIASFPGGEIVAHLDHK
ncbi:hypothetical protein DY000_02025192 [Brassica cretica]|uniref:D-aminoacyl-tRNA deacylase n=1 Tax=Brassica cretica TaxID=69181 RepID=A0ABQ7ECK1_BRACR|nr:hypothetical protein DY000_02025192 [Brassica cretica]